MGRLDDKVAIVTGSSGGIGSVVVRRFLEQGARVACFDITLPTADIVTEFGDRVFGTIVDITDEDSVRQGVADACAALGDVTVLVNTAAVLGTSKPPHEVDRHDFDRTFAVNVTGTWLCTKHTIPSMMRASRGSIVNVSSTAALVGGSSKSTYHATKGAIRAMSRADAMTYAEHNIRVNTIFPGATATPMGDRVAAESPEGAEVYRARMNAAHPLGRRGEPDDIAFGIIYLASDESKFMTGSELVIDGGYTAR